MARVEVVQCRCDRCKRVELVSPGPPKSEPDFQAKMGNKVIQYDDLCPRCRTALQNYWSDLEEWERDVNQPFGPAVAQNTAPPITPAPDYSPPKPHSMAASKK